MNSRSASDGATTPIFAETTGVRAWPTLGQLWHNHKPVFYLSARNARRLDRLQAPLDAFAHARDDSTFHVWITLETDPTILATILVNDPDLQRPGAAVFGNPETALPNHAYVPLVIGQNVIERILTNSSLPVAIHHQPLSAGRPQHAESGP